VTIHRHRLVEVKERAWLARMNDPENGGLQSEEPRQRTSNKTQAYALLRKNLTFQVPLPSSEKLMVSY
jgi:hypothetical protein